MDKDTKSLVQGGERRGRSREGSEDRDVHTGAEIVMFSKREAERRSKPDVVRSRNTWLKRTPPSSYLHRGDDVQMCQRAALAPSVY